jgi:hypothetical protein
VWILVIHNLTTNEVDLCNLGEDDSGANELAKAYIDMLERTRKDFKRLRFAITKPRPIVAYIPQ